MIFDLAGKWSFHEVGSSEWMTATVPGCNYTDLMANGKLDDPFMGMNEKNSLWVAERNWEYAREFTLPSKMATSKKIVLQCDMLDTLAEVYVNDRLLGKPDNAHVSWEYDITDIVCKLTNKIRIKLLSPVEYIEDRQEKDPMPGNMNGITGTPHVRKPQCHMGWDWGPTLPISGILRGIRICCYDVEHIKELKISQEHANGNVTLKADLFTGSNNAENEKIERRFTLIAPNGDKTIQTIETNSVEFAIADPELWQPCDISQKTSQPLYSLRVELVKNGNVIDESVKRVGLRTIKLDRKANEYGNNFRFVVNGVPIFAKGANWIPNDSFINRFDTNKLRYMLSAVQHANMNMIRVWGGGYYESDEFYDMCDEMGILVWQDFCFACAPYPFYNDEFLNNVKNEIEYNVKRLRHHASLALWCGNNEIEQMTAGWMTKRKLIEWENKFFYDILGGELRKYDTDTEFIEGSPGSGLGFMKKTNSDNFGDTHLWAVWHGLQPLNYYRKRFTRFCSEFGLESLCDMKTIEGFAEPKDYSLKSDIFMAHQKCTSGNSKMLFYMSTKYHIPANFQDIVYLSQLVQLECVKDATEHWRRNRGRCNGSLYWQLNDCWPVTSWSSIDYSGRYKALQYGARHFNAPISVSLEDKKGKVNLYVINDFAEPFKGVVNYRLESYAGDVADKGKFFVEIDEVSSLNVKTLDYKHQFGMKSLKDKVLFVDLTDTDGKIISSKTCLFVAEKHARLVDPKLATSVEVKNNIAYITVSADSFARSVMVSVAGTYEPLSDNFIDIPANSSVTLTMPSNGLSADIIGQRISLQSVATVARKGSSFGEFLFRAKVFIKPINFANWIYYMTT